ncbi:metal ABC transporter permease [Candidatus Haliotispira prima]|uniref:Metal ABC transporter permease n=1 Tax=Candidatus Haliotispira prima TaxID=3034016 RepID=A0ABY8ME92_9SPIO|nr:metal ABC transporter permease [Candidatus Haliotispira prima]
MSDIWQYLFRAEGRPLLYAFLFLLLAAPSFGTMGVYVSLKNYNAGIGTISHASLLGLGLAKYADYHWGWSFFTPFLGMLLISCTTAIMLFWLQSHQTIRTGTLLNVVWSTGMAIGSLLLQTVPGGVSMHSYLWGNILIVQNSDLWGLVALNVVIFLVLILPWRYHQLIMFDEEFAKSRGMATQVYAFIFYLLISYSIIVVISAVGILLSLGLFSIPSAIAHLFARNLRQMILYAGVVLLLSSWLGLFISVETNTTPGSFIIVILSAIYVLLGTGKYLVRVRFRRVKLS